MHLILRLTIIASLSLTLSACLNLKKQILQNTDAIKIETIAVINPQEPDKYIVKNFGHVGAAFGAVGNTIKQQSQSEMSAYLANTIKNNDFSFSRQLSDNIIFKLQAKGYKAFSIKNPEFENNKSTFDYSKIITDADAIILMETTTAGYISTTGLNDYIPAITIIVEMVKNSNKKILYREYFVFGWKPSIGEWIHIPSPVFYNFSNFDEMTKNDKRVISGLSEGINAITSRLIKDFPKK